MLRVSRHIDECASHLNPKYHIYTLKKVREHLLCLEGKIWTKLFLQSNYIITKLFNFSKSVLSKVASA